MPYRLTVETARRLRRTMTAPEVTLWQWLRTRPGGFKFRRQHPIGRYVADFYCPTVRLAIEVDGEAHGRGAAPQSDAQRDGWMEARGLRVMRVTANDVQRRLNDTTVAILAACATPLHRPAAGPPPHAAHGEE